MTKDFASCLPLKTAKNMFVLSQILKLIEVRIQRLIHEGSKTESVQYSDGRMRSVFEWFGQIDFFRYLMLCSDFEWLGPQLLPL